MRVNFPDFQISDFNFQQFSIIKSALVVVDTNKMPGEVTDHDSNSRSSSPAMSEGTVHLSSMVSKRFCALTSAPSKETLQSLARWVLFHRAHPVILSSLTTLFETHSTAQSSTTVSLPRILVYLNVIHEILVTDSAKSTGGGGDALMWEKYHDFRVAVGELVLLPALESIRLNFKTPTSDTVSQVDNMCERLKTMKDLWNEVDPFDSPTLFDDITRAVVLLEKEVVLVKKKLMESAPIAVDASNIPIEPNHDREDPFGDFAQDDDNNEEENDHSVGQPDLSSTSSMHLDKATHHPSDDLNASGDDHANMDVDEVSCGTAMGESFDDDYGPVETGKSEEILQDHHHKTSLLPMKRKAHFENETLVSPGDSPPRQAFTEQDDVVMDEFDTQVIPLGKVEIQELDVPNKAITAMQITRDLHGELTARLSALIATIPQSVFDICQAIQDSNTNAVDALKSMDLQTLPDEFLDIDLDGALASLRLYKDIILKQKEARKKCIELLMKSQCDIGFSCKEAAKLFYSMDSKLTFLNKKKEKIRDAMELEAMEDFEAVQAEVTSEGDEEEDPKEFSWFPKGDLGE